MNQQLEKIDIGETEITDVGVQYVARGCLSLKELLLWNCSKVTDIGLHYIGQTCKKVRLNYMLLVTCYLSLVSCYLLP